MSWEVAEDNPEHIDFWKITINKVTTKKYNYKMLLKNIIFQIN